MDAKGLLENCQLGMWTFDQTCSGDLAMMLQERDYSTLTPDEEAEWKALRQLEFVGESERFPIKRSLFRKYPRAARHFIQLFPNNYLDVVELADEMWMKDQIERLRGLLNTVAIKERDILSFIRESRSYFIVGSLLKEYFPFGHHGAFLFPELQLGNSFKADFVLVGKASDGWHFVLVELESPLGNVTTSNGDLGASFRKGIAQVADWDHWLESRFSSFSETFAKAKGRDASLPNEFLMLDKSRIRYVVVAGRRPDFGEKTYRIRRKMIAESSILLLHYDNLLDSAETVINAATY